VTSREGDEPVEWVTVDGRALESAAALAETELHDDVAETPRGALPATGYLI